MICNGVDVERFRPGETKIREAVLPSGFADQDSLLIGSVGRLEAVKDQLTLVRAFNELCLHRPDDKSLRLVLIGDGSQRDKLEELVIQEGILALTGRRYLQYHSGGNGMWLAGGGNAGRWQRGTGTGR
jgi:glycosyltransferase involved in cell wall biosynthesis